MKRASFPLIATALMLLLISGAVVADNTATPQIITGVLPKFKSVTAGWKPFITDKAMYLFWVLAGADFAWLGVTLVRDKRDIGEAIFAIISKLIILLVFWTLLIAASDGIPAIIKFFADIGQGAGGGPQFTMEPNDVLGWGIAIAADMISKLGQAGVLDRIGAALPVAFCALMVVFAYAVVAGQLLVTTLESYLMINAGIILMGFGGSRWTADFASSYMKFAVSTGIKLMFCYLIASMGNVMFSVNITPENIADSSMDAAGAALIYMYLGWQIPSFAAGLISGAPTQSLGSMMATAATAAAGMAAAGGAVASAVKTGAAEAGGMAKAAGSAYGAAQDMGQTGFGAAATAAGTLMGEMASSVGGKMKGSIGDAVADTTGGRLAQSIEGKRGAASMTGGGDVPGGPLAAALNSAKDAPGATNDGPAGLDSATPDGASSAVGGDNGGTSPMPSGDGSNAAIQPSAGSRGGAQKSSLAETISGLKQHLPEDQAGHAAPPIQMTHGKE